MYKLIVEDDIIKTYAVVSVTHILLQKILHAIFKVTNLYGSILSVTKMWR